MERRHAALSALFVAAGIGLAGCGHDHCYNCGDFGADPSGIYEGTLTDTVTQKATPAVAVIDENGDGRMMAQNGTYYAFGANTSGYNVFGNFLEFPGDGTTVKGSYNGSLTQAGLSATFTASGSDTAALSLNFDNNYFLASSLPTLAGSWSYTDTTSGFNLKLSIQSSGAFTGTDSDGCAYSGFFSLVDPNFNAYSESFSQTCGTAAAISYFGLSYYIPAAGSGSNATPAMINFLADDDNGHFVSALVQ